MREGPSGLIVYIRMLCDYVGILRLGSMMAKCLYWFQHGMCLILRTDVSEWSIP